MKIKALLIGVFLISGIIFLSAKKSEPTINDFKKIRGISLEAPSQRVDVDFFKELGDVYSNSVCLMPYAYIPKNSTEVRYGESTHQWWGEQKQGVEECIEMAQSLSLEIMVKPHLWIGWGQFTGDFDLISEEEWLAWEKSYSNYILDFATLAEDYKVELFCIGTELKTSVKKRPQYWSNLIDEIRNIYSGKLTYAGNWDSYKDFPFWSKLDYIGVDAYFPLSKSKTPSLAELQEGWIPWEAELNEISVKHDKPILFTEFGYCSTDFACEEPWKILKEENANENAQEIAYNALFETFWSKPWFAGGYVWKWHVPDHLNEERMQKKFTPQNKKAAEVLKSWYSKD